MEEEQTINEINKEQEIKGAVTPKQKRSINRKPKKKPELPNLGEFTTLMQSILTKDEVTASTIQDKISSKGAAIVVNNNYEIEFVAISLEDYQELTTK